MKQKKYFIYIACLLASLMVTKNILAKENNVKDGAPDFTVDVSNIPNAVPKPEPKHPFANPSTYEVMGKEYRVLSSNKGYDKVGVASWYGTKFNGKRTSTGEVYNMFAMSAASTELPIPSYAQVTNLQNGKQVIVKVNDRGPFHTGRIMDLSYAAAKKLGILNQGTGKVEIKAIHFDNFQEEGKFFIQLASFQQYNNARSFMQKVEKISNSPVKIAEAATSQSTVYRVQIGPLDSKSHAADINSKLSSNGIASGFIIAA